MHIFTVNIDKLPDEFIPFGFNEVNCLPFFNSRKLKGGLLDYIIIDNCSVFYNGLIDISSYLILKEELICNENYTQNAALFFDKVYYSIPYSLLKQYEKIDADKEFQFYKLYSDTMGLIKLLEFENIDCNYIDERKLLR